MEPAHRVPNKRLVQPQDPPDDSEESAGNGRYSATDNLDLAVRAKPHRGSTRAQDELFARFEGDREALKVSVVGSRRLNHPERRQRPRPRSSPPIRYRRLSAPVPRARRRPHRPASRRCPRGVLATRPARFSLRPDNTRATRKHGAAAAPSRGASPTETWSSNVSTTASWSRVSATTSARASCDFCVEPGVDISGRRILPGLVQPVLIGIGPERTRRLRVTFVSHEAKPLVRLFVVGTLGYVGDGRIPALRGLRTGPGARALDPRMTVRRKVPGRVSEELTNRVNAESPPA